jgi:hypothetical protein
MSTIEEKLTAFNETSEIKFGEASNTSSFRITVKGDDVVLSIKKESKKTADKIKLPKALVEDLTKSVVELNKILNPKNEKKGKVPKNETPKVEAPKVETPAPKAEAKVDAPKASKQKKEGNKRSKNTETPKEVDTAVRAAESVINDEAEEPKKEKKQRKKSNKKEKSTDAPKAEVSVAATATVEEPSSSKRVIDPNRAKVKNLPFDYTRDSFAQLLAARNVTFDEIVWRERPSKDNKEKRFSGYCFVRFATKDSCDAFIESFKDVEVNGRLASALRTNVASE